MHLKILHFCVPQNHAYISIHSYTMLKYEFHRFLIYLQYNVLNIVGDPYIFMELNKYLT